jgi:hypothetical protein
MTASDSPAERRALRAAIDALSVPGDAEADLMRKIAAAWRAAESATDADDVLHIVASALWFVTQCNDGSLDESELSARARAALPFLAFARVVAIAGCLAAAHLVAEPYDPIIDVTGVEAVVHDATEIDLAEDDA